MSRANDPQSLYPRHSRCASSCRRDGFTIVELLVASVVMTTALLGVYQVCVHALDAERRTSVQLNDLEAARALANSMEQALAASVHLGELDAIIAGPTSEGGRELMCQTHDRRARFTWLSGIHASGAGQVWSQEMLSAGACSLSVDHGMELPLDESWNAMAAQLIAADVEELSVQFRSVAQPSQPWVADWRSSSGEDALARIHIRIGEQSMDRMVWIRASGDLIKAGGEQ